MLCVTNKCISQVRGTFKIFKPYSRVGERRESSLIFNIVTLDINRDSTWSIAISSRQKAVSWSSKKNPIEHLRSHCLRNGIWALETARRQMEIDLVINGDRGSNSKPQFVDSVTANSVVRTGAFSWSKNPSALSFPLSFDLIVSFRCLKSDA